jgi:hypothetical protein
MAIRSVDRADGCTRIVVGDALTPDDVALVRDALGLDPRGRRVAIDLRGRGTARPRRSSCSLACSRSRTRVPSSSA